MSGTRSVHVSCRLKYVFCCICHSIPIQKTSHRLTIILLLPSLRRGFLGRQTLDMINTHTHTNTHTCTHTSIIRKKIDYPANHGAQSAIAVWRSIFEMFVGFGWNDKYSRIHIWVYMRHVHFLRHSFQSMRHYLSTTIFGYVETRVDMKENVAW